MKHDRPVMQMSCSPAGWVVLSEPLEILPLNDIRKHEAGTICWCNPIEDEDAIVHNAADRREDYVERGRKLN